MLAKQLVVIFGYSVTYGFSLFLFTNSQANLHFNKNTLRFHQLIPLIRHKNNTKTNPSLG